MGKLSHEMSPKSLNMTSKNLYIGLGLGLVYLPAIVCVTCYFEKKRAFATGIAVCSVLFPFSI